MKVLALALLSILLTTGIVSADRPYPPPDGDCDEFVDAGGPDPCAERSGGDDPDGDGGEPSRDGGDDIPWFIDGGSSDGGFSYGDAY